MHSNESLLTYLLKENLHLALKAEPDSIGELIDKWMSWAQRCRIPEFRELRKKIKRHLSAILATAKHHLSNTRIEAMNNKIKLIIRKSYGFRIIQPMKCFDNHIETGKPVISRIYSGSTSDKVSVRNLFEQVKLTNKLFVIDRGFYCEENISLFTGNGNSYIIPLAKNLNACRESVKNM